MKSPESFSTIYAIFECLYKLKKYNITNNLDFRKLNLRLTVKTAIILILTCIVGYYTVEAIPGQNHVKLQHVRLQLKWKHQFQFAGYYAAVQKGYYKDAGLDVELIEAKENEEPGEAVLNGGAEFGVATSDIVLMRAQGKKAVVLAPIFQHSPQVLLASKNSGIEHVHNLVGKRIMMEPHAADVITFMKDEGVPLSKCIVFPHNFDEQKLLDSEVDAMTAYMTDEPFVLQQHDFNYTVISPLSGGIDFYGDVLFTSEDLINKNPDMVEKFLDASLKGWKYAMSHEDEIIHLIYDKYSKRHSIDHLRYEAEKMKNFIIPDVVEIGYTNKGRWVNIINTYYNLGLIDRRIPTDGLLLSDYIQPKNQIPWKLVGIFLLILIVITASAFFFYSLSKRLKAEIKQREIIQSALAGSEKRFRSIFEYAGAGIVFTDSKGLILTSNQSFSELTGYDGKELKQYHISQITDKDDLPGELDLFNDLVDNKIDIFRYEKRFKTKENDSVWVDLTASAIRNESGTPDFLVFIANNITARKLTDAELKRKNEKLNELNATKDKFFSIIAHDLRSPISTLNMLLENMTSEYNLFDEKERLDYLVMLKNSAKGILELLENLLIWSRSQRGLLGFEPIIFDISFLVQNTLTVVKNNVIQKNITLDNRVNEKMTCFADINMISTVLRNIISNAVKFTRNGGRIIITSEYTENKKFLAVSVEDNGVGMNPNIMEKLFTLNNQISVPGTNQEKGSGLGLILCNEFIQKHGGVISVESKPDAGSKFTFTIPAAYSVIEGNDKLLAEN